MSPRESRRQAALRGRAAPGASALSRLQIWWYSLGVSPIRYALFDTAIGRCAIAWTSAGICALQLPEANDEATARTLLERVATKDEATLATKLPSDVRRAIAAVVALVAGEPRDLSDVKLDLSRVSPFYRKVYEVARSLGPGQTMSYGEVAHKLGSPKASRAVGQALGRNPVALIVPCHRVLAAGGKPGGFSAPGGVRTKQRLLEIEGVGAAGIAPEAAKKQAFSASASNGFDFDVERAVEHLSASDPKLAKLIERVGPYGLQLETTTSLFVALAQAIVYQQLTGKAAATIFGRVCAQFKGGIAAFDPERLLVLPEPDLLGCGLSRSKAAALRDLATRTSAGELPKLADLPTMSDEDIIGSVTRVKGIGRWTVEMLLMFRLGRPDVLPLGDYGIQKGFALTFPSREPVTRDRLAQRGERWRPFRSVASWYLWRAVDLAKSAEREAKAK